jgi:hypothetical protein
LPAQVAANDELKHLIRRLDASEKGLSLRFRDVGTVERDLPRSQWSRPGKYEPLIVVELPSNTADVMRGGGIFARRSV